MMHQLKITAAPTKNLLYFGIGSSGGLSPAKIPQETAKTVTHTDEIGKTLMK
jgi:hypothetical protein